jgi:hypothetical protein
MDSKDIETKVRRAAEEQGWTIRATKDGLAFIPADKSKRICQWHHTTSDHRAPQNFLSVLRRSGFIWPWPPK